jgi:hypothetical protein
MALEPLGVVLTGVRPSTSDPIERRCRTGRVHYSSSTVFGKVHASMTRGSVRLSLSPTGGIGPASKGFCPLCCLLDCIGPSLCGVQSWVWQWCFQRVSDRLRGNGQNRLNETHGNSWVAVTGIRFRCWMVRRPVPMSPMVTYVTQQLYFVGAPI